jgi:hypothetical protein
MAAPLVFHWTWELPMALAAAAALAAALSRRPARLGGRRRGCCRRWWPAAIGLHDYAGFIRQGAIDISRNFYGTLRVQQVEPDSELNARWRLLHGVIIHGEQYRHPDRQREPTTYYGASSGIGRTIQALREAEPARAQRVGLIGLGVGTLATYGRAGDHYRIYELNPAGAGAGAPALQLPRAKRRATIATPLGDARLVLERESPQALDVLAVDAFSSDSIPVHLITLRGDGRLPAPCARRRRHRLPHQPTATSTCAARCGSWPTPSAGRRCWWSTSRRPTARSTTPTGW